MSVCVTLRVCVCVCTRLVASNIRRYSRDSEKDEPTILWPSARLVAFSERGDRI